MNSLTVESICQVEYTTSTMQILNLIAVTLITTVTLISNTSGIKESGNYLGKIAELGAG